jgi:alpha-D-ribose 1-methylphosphonate 5-triphosphate synthase subunit PhnH
MNRETAYDDVFDAQRHFRSVLDSMARPGKVNRLAGPVLSPPSPFLPTSAAVAFALLNADVTFHLAGFNEAASAYLIAHTRSRSDVPANADFLFLHGNGDASPIREAKTGVPAYPEGGATVVIQVEQVGKSSSVGGLQLTLEGPGIESREIVFVTGLNPGLLEALRERNREFPLGVDAILVTPNESLFCLPRTTRVTWNNV